jgi:hypothetical protein
LESLTASVLAVAAAVESSPVGQAMRGGVRGLYPAVNVLHLTGLVLLVGCIGVLDLRTAGLGRRIPLQALSRFLTPPAIAGLLLMTISGLLLFSADAGPLVRSPLFGVKLALIALGLCNAALFRRLFGDFEGQAEAPPLARAMSVLSIAAWTSAGVVGRLLAYA